MGAIPSAVRTPPRRPYAAVRALEFSPPLFAPGDAVMDAIAAELKRNGNTVRRVTAGRIEFDGPGLFTITMSFRRAAAANVRGGVVALDPADPRRRIYLELRWSALLTVMPMLVASIAVLGAWPVMARAIALLMIGMSVGWNVFMARHAYESWITTAARRAGDA
jgi:hypothetical protein